MDSYPQLTIISGATATGKTAYALDHASRLQQSGKRVVIINFDSLLFYKELIIGTAKPTAKEQQEIPHLMVDVCSAHSPMNAHSYSQQAVKHIQNELAKRSIIFLVGGSGFYLRALIKGMYDSPTICEKTRQQVALIMKKEGIAGIRSLLEKFDLDSFKSLHTNDHYRNIRALEHWFEHHVPLSLQKKEFEKKSPYDFSINPHNWQVAQKYLTIEKNRHWSLIKERTVKMIEHGLIAEVTELLNRGFSGQEKPLQSIGYKETISYLQGSIKTKDELIERIYIATRRLAKAQKTFFKKTSPREEITR